MRRREWAGKMRNAAVLPVLVAAVCITSSTGSASRALRRQRAAAIAMQQPLLLAPERAARLTRLQGSPTWRTAGGTAFPGAEALTLAQGMAMMGAHRVGRNLRRARQPVVVGGRSAASVEAPLPAAFDVRDVWWRCSAVSRVMHQGPCGSCYAVASADVASASICIQSGGVDDVVFSAQDMLSCSDGRFSCDGGFIEDALGFLCSHGAAEESCVTYRAGDSWDHGNIIDDCRRTCEMDQPLVVRRTGTTTPLLPKPKLPAVPTSRLAKAQKDDECAASYSLFNTEAAVKDAIFTTGPV